MKLKKEWEEFFKNHDKDYTKLFGETSDDTLDKRFYQDIKD